MKTESMEHGKLSEKDLDLLTRVAWGRPGWIARWQCRRLVSRNPEANRLLAGYRTNAQEVREAVRCRDCPDELVMRLMKVAAAPEREAKVSLVSSAWSRMAPIAALGLCVIGAGMWWNYSQKPSQGHDAAEAAFLARQSIVMVSEILGRPSVDACEIAVKQSAASQIHGTMFTGVNTIKERLAYENE